MTSSVFFFFYNLEDETFTGNFAAAGANFHLRRRQNALTSSMALGRQIHYRLKYIRI